MRTAVGGLSWVEWDARMAIAARATRSFSQSAVAVLIAIYLGLHGFSLVQVGAFLNAWCELITDGYTEGAPSR
jgi:hypothetical protein